VPPTSFVTAEAEPDDASVFLPLEVDLSGMTNLVRFNLRGRVEPDKTGELNAIRDFGLDNLLPAINDGAARATAWPTYPPIRRGSTPEAATPAKSTRVPNAIAARIESLCAASIPSMSNVGSASA